jgi:UDP-glucose 4-epimerase
MHIFITGGAGFIGSNLVKYLLEKNCYTITVYDNLSTVNCGINNIKKYIDENQINFINGDILNNELLTNSMKNHDIVIHLAAQLEVTASYNNPIYDLNVNLIGTINIINACVKNNINRLINASSACVYGFTDGHASNENDHTNPNWEYGISKLAAEKYIQIAHNTHQINYTSLRFSIVYGINEWYGRVLTIFTKRAIENKNPIIFGDGNQERDYINVWDVCEFIYECIINENTYNQNYNVSTGEGISINNLAKQIKEIFKEINIL